MQLSFSKYAGSGNDFVLIDNRESKFVATPALVRSLCDRKRGIGADGVIALEKGTKAPFRMRIYNADGFEAEMCGNGIRCLKKFIEELGITTSPLLIETHERLLEVSNAGVEIRASMGDPTEYQKEIDLGEGIKVDYINTGVPHAILFVNDLDTFDINKWGPYIRNHPHFQPRGTNANFVEKKENELFVRTWERGVEGETLACGTGVVASALLAAERYSLMAPIAVTPKSKEAIMVDFKINDNQIRDVTQTGPAHYIFQGSFNYGSQSC